MSTRVVCAALQLTPSYETKDADALSGALHAAAHSRGALLDRVNASRLELSSSTAAGFEPTRAILRLPCRSAPLLSYSAAAHA